MKTVFDNPFVSIGQQSLFQIKLPRRRIADICPPAQRFLMCGQGGFLPGDRQHLVTKGDNLAGRAVRVAPPASNILGLALFLAFKGISQKPFNMMRFEDGGGRVDQLGFLLNLVFAARGRRRERQ